MKGLELLPISEDQRKLILDSASQYENEQIYFSVLAATDDEVTIRVFQRENSDDKYLTRKELNQLVKNIFSEPCSPRAVHSRPIPFIKDKIEDYTSIKILAEMEELNLDIKKLVKLLNIDKTSFPFTITW